VAVAASRVVQYLAAEGFEVHVIHPFKKESGGLEEVRTRENGSEVLRLKYSSWGEESAVALVRLIVQAHRRFEFDIFHAFFLTTVWHCTYANQLCATSMGARPVIASIRGSDATNYILYPYWRDVIREGLEKCTWVTSVSQFCLDHIRAELNVNLAHRSTVIRNGVAAPEPEKRWSLTNENRGVVGTTGAFRMVKDIPLLVRGYGGLPKGLRRKLVLAGFFENFEPDEEKWSRTLMQEFGISHEVSVTGRFPHPEVGKHLRSMHVYAQTSAYEGLPNALLEAAAHGLPLVATAVSGMKEILSDGETGLLVPHGDPAALTCALRRVMEDDVLARRLSEGARRLASELDCDAERKQWTALYSKLACMARDCT
jgi:glycosyltransferase involved in cell wall biosynthesis